MENLTNEAIRGKFKGNQFELVRHTIQLADQLIHSGRAPRVKTDNLNPQVIVVQEVTEGRDVLDSIDYKSIVPVKVIVKEEIVELPTRPAKNTEKKKARRILA